MIIDDEVIPETNEIIKEPNEDKNTPPIEENDKNIVDEESEIEEENSVNITEEIDPNDYVNTENIKIPPMLIDQIIGQEPAIQTLSVHLAAKCHMVSKCAEIVYNPSSVQRNLITRSPPIYSRHRVGIIIDAIKIWSIAISYMYNGMCAITRHTHDGLVIRRREVVACIQQNTGVGLCICYHAH